MRFTGKGHVMSDTYIPKDHEIRASAIIHRAPLIHRQMLGSTLLDAEKVATAEWEAWLATHDAAVRATALREAADGLMEKFGVTNRAAGWLRARAEQEGNRAAE